MFIFRHGGRLACQARQPLATTIRRSYASRIEIPFTPPSFPVIESCPSPTCTCREAPAGLEIEREQSLNGSMAAYAQQVLISTGRDDWKSRIEDEDEAVFLKPVKQLMGRGGKYSDPYHNVLLTNSSFPPTPVTSSPGDETTSDGQTASAYLVPSFQYVPSIPTEPSALEAFLKGFVLPSRLHQSHDRLTRQEQDILRRQPELQEQFPSARKVDEILVLICGHGGRDQRCGVLGPLLRDEFEEKLNRQDIAVLKDPPAADAEPVNTVMEAYVPTARVGLISHIGGHKFAGNVIIYIPPSFKTNPLAGKGIWYGRVGPEHVEGIVAKTILDGKVIKDMFRGGIDQSGEILRL